MVLIKKISVPGHVLEVCIILHVSELQIVMPSI